MVQVRQSLFFIIIGTNGTGKTTLLNNTLNKSNRNNILVIDPDGYEWRDYKEVDINFLENLKQGTNKVLAPTKDDIELLINFRNGILVLDDCRYYANKRLENEIRKILIRRRQNALDIFAVAHSLSEVPNDFYTFATHIIIFKTNDSVVRLRQSVDRDKLENLKNVIDRVNQHKDRHYFEIVSLNRL
jgi:ABC-type Mn2+/Zn2+ transport system ATPase subunit